MAKRLSDDIGSVPVFDFYCEFCRKDGKMLEARGYCVDCGEYLCSTCYTRHRRRRGNRHHVLIDKDTMLKNAQSIIDSHEFKSFIQVLNQSGQRSHSIIQLVEDNISKSQTWCSEVVKSVHIFREEINSLLDELERGIIAQAENLQKEEERTFRNISDNITTSLQSVQKIAEELDHLQTSRKECEIYIKMQESKNAVTEIQTKLDEAEKENVVSEYVFHPSTKLTELLNIHDGIGKLSLQTPTIDVAMPLGPYDPTDTEATHFTDIEVKSSDDENICGITGLTMISNNRLIIVDSENFKVKLIDTQRNKVISELTMSSRPWDVTVIGRNQAAVASCHDSKIFLLSVSDTLTLDREITVSDGCKGLAYSRNRLVVTYPKISEPGKLEIIDLSGKVLKCDSDGSKLFDYPEYVCVSKDEETIYVSDSGSEKVISLTFDGVVKSVFRSSELDSPEKVCVDHHGNVYVCCYYSGNVLMLTADLTKIQTILSQEDGMGSCLYSICHCQETNRLYVGSFENTKVKVYQLSQ